MKRMKKTVMEAICTAVICVGAAVVLVAAGYAYGVTKARAEYETLNVEVLNV